MLYLKQRITSVFFAGRFVGENIVGFVLIFSIPLWCIGSCFVNCCVSVHACYILLKKKKNYYDFSAEWTIICIVTFIVASAFTQIDHHGYRWILSKLSGVQEEVDANTWSQDVEDWFSHRIAFYFSRIGNRVSL